MRNITRGAAVAAVSAGALFAGFTGTAEAVTGSYCVYQGSDRACAVNYSTGTAGFEVCDNEADGNGVYAYFYVYAGIQTVRDGNGSAAGCGKFSSLHHATKIKICEDDYGADSCVTRSIP